LDGFCAAKRGMFFYGPMDSISSPFLMRTFSGAIDVPYSSPIAPSFGVLLALDNRTSGKGALEMRMQLLA